MEGMWTSGELMKENPDAARMMRRIRPIMTKLEERADLLYFPVVCAISFELSPSLYKVLPLLVLM